MCTGPKGNGLRIQVKEIPVMEFVGEELGRQVQKKSAKDALSELDLNQEYEDSFGKRLRDHLSFVYPYAADVTLHIKMSVSEMKKMGQLTDDEEAETPFEAVLLWPRNLRITGKTQVWKKTRMRRRIPEPVPPAAPPTTARWSCFPLTRSRAGQMWNLAGTVCGRKQYPAENLKMVDCAVIWNFLQSETGHGWQRLRRMEGFIRSSSLSWAFRPGKLGRWTVMNWW